MKTYLRNTFLFIGILLSFTTNAQMYERGKKNFFLEPEGSVNFSNHKPNAFTGSKFGTSFGLSGGKVFAGFLKTGLVYRYNQAVIGNLDSSSAIDYNLQNQFAGIKVDMMIPFLSSYGGKSKHYECKTFNHYFFLGPEFGYNFATKAPHYSMSKTSFLLDFSYAVLFKRSGSNKKQAANDIFVALNLKKGFSPFAQYDVNGPKFYSTYWGISIVWIRYKTGNWLGN